LVDYSKIEKQLEKFKAENAELKLKLNDSRKLKEQEEALMLEIANLKGEIKYL
jgi:hypothetical protein